MEWIKVTDRLPPDMTAVIVTVKANGEDGTERRMTINFPVVWTGEEWAQVAGDPTKCLEIFPIENAEVTHWMPWPTAAED